MCCLEFQVLGSVYNSIILSDLNHIQRSEKCQSSWDKLTTWLSNWRLKANCSKTDLLVFHGNCDVPKLSGESVNECSSTKILGNTVDEILNFEAHLMLKCPLSEMEYGDTIHLQRTQRSSNQIYIIVIFRNLIF